MNAIYKIILEFYCHKYSNRYSSIIISFWFLKGKLKSSLLRVQVFRLQKFKIPQF